jgi:hypothetical protein
MKGTPLPKAERGRSSQTSWWVLFRDMSMAKLPRHRRLVLVSSWGSTGGKCRLRMTGGDIIDQYGLACPLFAHDPALQISTHGWSDSRNGKLLEECLATGLPGDVSNRHPQILERRRGRSETDLTRMVPQLMAFCT